MSREPAHSAAEPLQYSNLPDVIPSEGRLLAAFGGAILLTLVSLVVVLKDAHDEPYMTGVEAGDLIPHVIGAACMLGWIAYAVTAINQLRRRRSTYAVIIAMLVWAIINIFYLPWRSLDLSRM